MIELTSSLLIFLAALHGGFSGLPASPTPVYAQEISPKIQTIEAPLTLEQYVREYFKDTPILAEISKCESTFMQFDDNGNVIRGKVNHKDVGVMQINEYYHASTAKQLGYDLSTVEGNLAYAKYLYNKEGADPWISSSKCWSKSQAFNNFQIIAGKVELAKN